MNSDPIFEKLSERETEAWHKIFPDLYRGVQFLLTTHPLLGLSEEDARQVAIDGLVEVVGRFSALPINSTENLKIFIGKSLNNFNGLKIIYLYTSNIELPIATKPFIRLSDSEKIKKFD